MLRVCTHKVKNETNRNRVSFQKIGEWWWQLNHVMNSPAPQLEKYFYEFKSWYQIRVLCKISFLCNLVLELVDG